MRKVINKTSLKGLQVRAGKFVLEVLSPFCGQRLQSPRPRRNKFPYTSHREEQESWANCSKTEIKVNKVKAQSKECVFSRNISLEGSQQHHHCSPKLKGRHPTHQCDYRRTEELTFNRDFSITASFVSPARKLIFT